MRRDPRAYLWDGREAADAIAGFTQDRNFDDYAGHLMFRSAVERQLAIIGEALSQLAKVDQGLAARIPELRRVIAFAMYSSTATIGLMMLASAHCAGRLAAVAWAPADLLVELGEP
jgi:hypothetical protein